MPTGYRSEGKTYSKKLGRWLKKDLNKAFDYDDVDTESVALLINFFRWYPDYFADLFRDAHAKFQLELPQRIILRAFARYRNVYITGARGLTKTFLVMLSALIEGILFPGHKVRYVAPRQNQGASLATKAFHQIEQCYPIITGMWNIKNDRSDMFYIAIPETGSELTIFAPRGDTSGAVIGEECAEEGKDGFPMDEFIHDIYPAVRDNRMINQHKDEIHINLKHQHISNASSKLNRAYTELRSRCLKDMLYEKPFEGLVIDMSWVTAFMGNIRDEQYIKDQKRSLTPLGWEREMMAHYTGSNENPLISDESIAKSRKLMAMEDCHCGNPKVIYIVSHDVSYEDGAGNAKCADVVLKLIPHTSYEMRDKFDKHIIYVDCYNPPKTAYEQAQKLKSLWLKYCDNEAQATYLVVDAQAYGRDIVEELMKPPMDGSRPLCCYKHQRYQELEQPGALPVIYPLKAGSGGAATESEDEMLKYAQKEFESGNVKLLTSDTLDGVEQYKRKHNIKDNFMDGKIILPYKKTDELCAQIQNLTGKIVGTKIQEVRRSKAKQRDIWSALKYALRMAQLLEQNLVKINYRAKSDWDEYFAPYENGTNPWDSGYRNPQAVVSGIRAVANEERKRLIGLRRR